MVLLDMANKPIAVRSFECELLSLDLTKEIKYKFEPVVNINNIRQCCKFIKPPKKDKHKLSMNEEYEEENISDKLSLFISSPSTSTLNTSSCKAKTKVKSNEGFLLSDDHSQKVKLEFKNFSEYVEVGDYIVINEPYMKAFGRISNTDQT